MLGSLEINKEMGIKDKRASFRKCNNCNYRTFMLVDYPLDCKHCGGKLEILCLEIKNE